MVAQATSAEAGDWLVPVKHPKHTVMEIPIATGAQWEMKVEVNTALEFEDDTEVRTFEVNAWTDPAKLESVGLSGARRIQFEPARFKVVPKKYAKFIADPFAATGANGQVGGSGGYTLADDPIGRFYTAGVRLKF